MPTITNYTYSIANDTENGKVVLSRLDMEIRDSNVTIALDGISVAGDVLTITFKDVLPAEDQTELDDVVATHDGTPLDSIEPAIDEKGNQVVVLDGGKTQIGMQSVQVLDTPDISSDLIKSYQVTVPPQTTEILDIFVGDDLTGPIGKCYLAGGEYRCRTAAAEGSALHFSIVDRNDVLGYFVYYGMSRTKLSGLTFNNGTLADVQVGDDAWGGTSGAHTVVLGKGADYLEIQFHEATFQDGENLTFTRGGAPVAGVDATLGTWDEGDVIEVIQSVKDEWIEGLDVRDVHPGGSKEVPEGMYFRVRCYNADPSNVLRVKVSLTVGRL
jgi:hypothetical protein